MAGVMTSGDGIIFSVLRRYGRAPLISRHTETHWIVCCC